MGDTQVLAKGYTLVNSTQYSAGQFLLARLHVVPGSRVLDVGCGPGDLTAYIASLVGPTGDVVGIDPSKERIAIARDRLNTNELSNLKLSFFEGRAEDLSRFADNSFDVVYVNSTFHWVTDQPRAMTEFYRVLKTGGRVGISGGSGDFVAIHEKIKEEVLAREPFRAYTTTTTTTSNSDGPKFLKRVEIEQLLDLSGFGGRSIVTNKIVKEARDGEEMIEWLDTSSSGKTYGGIPLELRPQAKEEMKREWDKYTTPTGIYMDMELLVTVAYKD